MTNTTINNSITQNTMENKLLYQCSYGTHSGEVRQDMLYSWGNNLAGILVSSLGVILAFGINTLILVTLYKNKTRSIHEILAGVLASVSLFTTAVAQVPYILTKDKVYILLDIWQVQKANFCHFLLITTHGGRLSILFSITCIFGITIERYMAVFHPIVFRSKKTMVLKLMAWIFLAQTGDVACKIAFQWYKPVTKIVGIIQCVGTLFFTFVAYTRIHYKLKPELQSRAKSSVKAARQKRRVITSIMVVSVFLFCFIPVAVLQAVGISFEKKTNKIVNLYITPWLIVVLFLSSSVNPMVYAARDERFASLMKSQLRSLLRFFKDRNIVHVLQP